MIWRSKISSKLIIHPILFFYDEFGIVSKSLELTVKNFVNNIIV